MGVDFIACSTCGEVFSEYTNYKGCSIQGTRLSYSFCANCREEYDDALGTHLDEERGDYQPTHEFIETRLDDVKRLIAELESERLTLERLRDTLPSEESEEGEEKNKSTKRTRAEEE